MDAARAAVVGTWVIALAGVVAVVAVVPGAAALTWLALAAGLAVAVGMAGQLVFAERTGFVVRLAAASGGAFAVVLLGALVALLRA